MCGLKKNKRHVRPILALKLIGHRLSSENDIATLTVKSLETASIWNWTTKNARCTELKLHGDYSYKTLTKKFTKLGIRLCPLEGK